jgi:hypothetical protein
MRGKVQKLVRAGFLHRVHRRFAQEPVENPDNIIVMNRLERE